MFLHTNTAKRTQRVVCPLDCVCVCVLLCQRPALLEEDRLLFWRLEVDLAAGAVGSQEKQSKSLGIRLIIFFAVCA